MPIRKTSVKRLNLDALYKISSRAPSPKRQSNERRAPSPKRISKSISPKRQSNERAPSPKRQSNERAPSPKRQSNERAPSPKRSPRQTTKRSTSPKPKKTPKGLDMILNKDEIFRDEILTGSASKVKRRQNSVDYVIKNDKDLGSIEELVLREHQIPHVEKIKQIFMSHYIALDLSTMGAGKTYTASKLSLDFNYKNVLVVCPVSVESKWKGMYRYGVKINRVLSFQGLRSVKNKTPKHGLLDRYDIEDEESGTTKTFFTPTEELIKMIKEGILFVIDEVQNIKNKNDQFLACQAIIREIIGSNTGSRILFLSGTPIDKEEHAINMMQAMGIIKSSRLAVFIKEESRNRYYGAFELENYIKDYIGKQALDEFKKRVPYRADNVPHVCYLMFQQLLKPAIAAAMPSPPLEIDCKNGYYKITEEEDKKALIKAIAELQASARYNEKTGAVIQDNSNMGAIQKARNKIETAKVNDIIRIARQTLESDPNCKVGIFLEYLHNIDSVEDGLMDYKPLVIVGSVSKDRRPIIFDKFQEPNNKYRVIIAITQTVSTGIDLDDKHGGFPRYAFASPSYNIQNIHQLSSRFVRLDSKSPAIFRLFYGSVSRKEVSILNALARKANVLKDTLEGQNNDGQRKFPGEYEDEIEY